MKSLRKKAKKQYQTYRPIVKAKCSVLDCTDQTLITVESNHCDTCGLVICKEHVRKITCKGREGHCSFTWTHCPSCETVTSLMPCMQCKLMNLPEGPVEDPMMLLFLQNVRE